MKRTYIFTIAFLWVFHMINAQSNILSYAESLFEQGEDEYFENNNIPKAKEAYSAALNILETNGYITNLLYYQILEELAGIADEEEDYLSAIHYMERAIAVNNDTVKSYIEKDEGVYTPYRKLSDYLAKAGMWNKAISLKQKRLELKSENDMSHDIDFDLSFEDYMYWVKNANYFKYALRILNEHHVKYKDKFYDYWLGICYFNLRDYEKALSSFTRANSDYGLAITYAAKGEVTKAVTLLQYLVTKEKEDRKHTIYIGHEPLHKYISTLAHLYILAGQFDKAISCELENESSVDSYLNLSRAYAGNHQWEDAKKYALKICQMQAQEKYLTQALMYLSEYSYLTHNYSDLEKFVSQLLVTVTKELLSTLNELTYDERSRYIEEYSNILSTQIPMYSYYTQSDSLISMSYNASLIIKGALLNSENSIKRIISESNDSSLKKLWEDLRANKYILSKRIEKDSAYMKLQIDSLQDIVYQIEDSLVLKCKEYGDITRSMKLKWDDVRNTLQPEDIAIEFLSFPTQNDSVMYVALSLRKDSENPKMTILFEEKQLKNVSDTLYYQCDEMTEFVWKPLLPELKGIKNIFFSPSGALYRIGIEYLPSMDNYNLYRLSSTRELINRYQENDFKQSAALYGGLNYARDYENIDNELCKIDLNEEKRSERLKNYKSSLDDITEETAIEIDSITNILLYHKCKPAVYKYNNGTEDSFKALSGSNINILHISTHGFYWDEIKAAENNKKNQMSFLKEMSIYSKEDKALSRSGLLFSGSKWAMDGNKVAEDEEDGIATAREIADLDFRKTDLVSLSACQTGLGELSSSEGVFGLQRGFKKAGVKSILMSLWDVNDESTRIFMIEFYKIYLSTGNKFSALKAAQNYLRNYMNEKGEICYDKPKFWAAFILLDAF